MIANISNKITRLTEIWQHLLIDHHKDRDCHFFIEQSNVLQSWSYGEPKLSNKIGFTVLHYGYIGEEIEERFDTIQEAQEFLYETLKEMCKKEIKQWLKVCNDNKNWDQEFALNHKDKFLKFQKEIERLE